MRAPRRLLVTALLLVTVGCSGQGEGPRFASGGGPDVRCMQHQPEPPGSRYTDPQRKDTAEVFEVLRYYTANGRKPYCDGQAPTETDREWAQYYVSQGGAPSNVAPLLRER